MKKSIILVALIALCAGSLAAFETTKTLQLSAADLKDLEIRAGAGSLKVVGRDGLASIEVKAEIVARHVGDEDMAEYLKDRVELVLEKRGDGAVLISRIRDRVHLFNFGDEAVINLTVSVPKSLPLNIDDGSGWIEVEDVASLEIDDGSGSIRVDRVSGPVKIDDGSGGIEVNDVSGDVTIDDGSGEIVVRRVGGTVTIDDGSGSIDVEHVEKDVRLISTGSGGVNVSDVKGQVIRPDHR